MSVAISYAKALFQAAKENQLSAEVVGTIESQMDSFHAFLDSSKEGRVALFGPLTSTREKLSLIENITKQLNFNPLLSQFFALLARKGRLALLGEIRDAFNSVRLTQEGGVAGRLVAAEPMSESDIGILTKAFSQKFGKKVAFRMTTDPSLLAGMKVTVNGVTYDGSLRSQIQKLRDQFVAGMPGEQN